MNNLRTIFWLLVVTMAAVSADVFVSWRTPGDAVRPNHALMDPAFSANRITLLRPGAPDTVVEKTDRWSLVRPYAGSVDAQVVLRLLDALSAVPVSEVMSGAELLRLDKDRGNFGLEPPSLRLDVSGATGSISVDFGVSTPASNGVYAAVSGSDSVLIVPRSVWAAADLQPDAFRERALFPYDPEFVLGFDLRKAGEAPVSFARKEEGWTVGRATASSAKVKSFLERLTGASALDFCWPVGATNEGTVASEALLVGYGLDSGAAITVSLRCRDGIDRHISFGNDVGEDRAYALIHNGSAVVSVDAAVKDAALEGVRSFEDGRLFPVDAGSVASFTLTDGETSYVLARTAADAWRLDSPVTGPADAAVASALLGRILALTPADVAESGLGVSVSTNGSRFVVTPTAVLGDARLEDIRSREILKVDATLVRRLVSTPGGRRPGAPVSVAYSRDRRSWNVETDADPVPSANVSAIESVVAVLSPLRAERIVTLAAAASELSRYGLENPYYTLAVDQEKDGAVRRNIFIGNETKGGRFATVGSAEAIFVLSKKTVSALTAPLLED